MVDYVLNVLAALSQLLNAVLGGDRDETFSSRTGRAQRDGRAWGRIVAPVIDFVLGRHHCRDNIGH